MPVSRFLRNARVDELLLALEKVEVDAFVAFGHDALQVARDLAKKIDAPILQEVVSMRQAKRVRKSSACLEMASSNAYFRTIHSNKVGKKE